MTFTLATTGPLPNEERDRLDDLFRSSTLVEVAVQETVSAQARVTFEPVIWAEER